jgi:hypothetical protein
MVSARDPCSPKQNGTYFVTIRRAMAQVCRIIGSMAANRDKKCQIDISKNGT